MSVEFLLFLRDKPRVDGDSIGAMAVDIVPYAPAVGDPIEHQPWRASIRWVIHASGRISDWDEWDEFVHGFDGWLWSAATGELEQIDRQLRRDAADDRREDLQDAEDLAKLKALMDQASTSPKVMATLKTSELIDTTAFRVHVTELLVARAKQRDPLPPWRWALRHVKQAAWIPEVKTPGRRATFAKKGPLAAAIVEHIERRLKPVTPIPSKRATEKLAKQKRDRFAKWVKEPDIDPPLIEKRRRAGETMAGIPRSTAILLASGKLEAAIAEYAKRYGLAVDVARKVVLANEPEFRDVLRAERS
jgi:hypothetical protein